ncbi:hypothetical protein [Caldicellulosiruptor bescii]|uniref:Uncharacterized protein n=2 Tax=Caldicellulosiruptor bescii TaxID=31899 RepID=B9MLB0_CALBD|nr:hypothetical protein [Caldicellulosiruptor bescii]ACM61100.1 hypothetical protein Athe_2023 [Caldicellulosiruptor bescii DSM 6725]
MNSVKKTYRNDVNSSPEAQGKIQHFVKELIQETESKEIDKTVERFIRKHKNILLELAKG